uniref:Uncharacterized protein n=1 Tax=Arundo donax TaxID=35708 RepID=A0A0A8Y7Q5_ARUDO
MQAPAHGPEPTATSSMPGRRTCQSGRRRHRWRQNLSTVIMASSHGTERSSSPPLLGFVGQVECGEKA